MKNPVAVYKADTFIDVKTNPIFILLSKYFEYHREYDYTVKANECYIQLDFELSSDTELISLLEKYKFRKV